MIFEIRKITEYQRWARMGYVQPLICHNEKIHPLLIADSESYEVAVRCVICSYRRELGLKDQLNILEKIRIAELVFENE